MKPIRKNRLLLLVALVVLTGVLGLHSCNNSQNNADNVDQLAPKKMEKIVGEEVAKLTSPPMVPPPITRKNATKVVVNLEIIEKEMRMADGVTYTFWTYGGQFPEVLFAYAKGTLWSSI